MLYLMALRTQKLWSEDKYIKDGVHPEIILKSGIERLVQNYCNSITNDKELQ